MKPKYEISVWEDVLSADGKSFEEKKIIVIGSDTMTSESRAREPKLVTNINGTNKFTFNMYYSYIDTRTGEKVKNPYIQYLVNERKIKVFWKDEWYDLLIKQIKEDQVQHLFTYTCEDVYVTELSRTGFELTFATELENNIGTAKELVNQVIENTDWRYDEDNSDKIYQETEEPVYEASMLSLIQVKPDVGDDAVYLMVNMPILLYYSCAPDINNLKTSIQIYYAGAPFEQDENDMLVVNGTSYSLEVTWETSGQVASAFYNSQKIFEIDFGVGISKRYRAKRYVQSQRTVYNDIVGRYVNVYNDGELLGYNTTEFNDALSVVNLFTNPSNFSNTSGWKGKGLTFKLSPSFGPGTLVADYTATSYLQLPATGKPIFNMGIQNSRPYLPNGFIVGERYILRLKLKVDGEEPHDTDYVDRPGAVRPSIQGRDIDYNPTFDYYFEISDSRYVTNEKWLEYTMTCIKSCPYDKILDTSEPFGIFLEIGETYWLEEAQFYKEVYGENGEGELVRIDPNALSIQSVAQEQWKYFAADQPEGTTKDSLVYDHISIGPWDEAEPVYNDFERYGTIEADNSNRFNILQNIAEAFECWVRFYIEHDEHGYIIYDDGLPRKWIRLKRETGQETGIGFIYGIDLKGITRTLKSDKISTKTIVEQNENEFGKNGFCSIARSEQNYPKENFIYNFDYYIQHGLLDKNALYDDLYNIMGYYPQLHTLNTEYAHNLELLTNYKLELTKQTATSTVYNQYILSTEDEISSIDDSLMKLAGVKKPEDVEEYINTHANDTKVQALISDKTQLKTILKTYQILSQDLQTSINTLNDEITTKTARQNEIITELTALNKQFYVKYSRFIQEGTWTSEDYWDDDLYYLDAMQVAYQSSRPQISYEINVLRLSDLDDYSSKIFNLGDISFVQDTEYFGYKEDKITPYKEKVVLTEITSFFDTPDKDTIKVQNYKNQFDDLFQRITAAVQNLEFTQGKYAKAANIMASDGTIRSSVIQNTFNENKDLVYGAQNESATIDNTGITVIDNSDAAKQVKVTSGGVFVTNDGGETWKNAVRGDGISTDLLTAGRINTEQITVYNGNYPSFRWDPNGLNAYSFDTDIKSATYGKVDTSKFIRFDQYGIYGLQNADPGFVPDSEIDIYDRANFGLTWNRFFMKSQENGKFIEISTDKDIVVSDGQTDRIVIGRVDGALHDNYGIRVRAQAEEKQPVGDIIFQCDNNGSTISGWTLTKDALQSKLIGSNQQCIRIEAGGNIGCYGHDPFMQEEDAYQSTSKEKLEVTNLTTGDSSTLAERTKCFLFVSQVGQSEISYQIEQLNTDTQSWNNSYKPTSMPDIQIVVGQGKNASYYELTGVDIVSTLSSYSKTLVRQYERPKSDNKTETVYVYNYIGQFTFKINYDSKLIFEINDTTTIKSNYYVPAADTKWSIDKDGRAIFHDIYADSGTIAGWFINNEKIYQTTNGKPDGPIKQQLSTTGSTKSVADYSFITDAINAAVASIAGLSFKNGLIDGYSIANLFRIAQGAQETANYALSRANEAYNHLPSHSHRYARASGGTVTVDGTQYLVTITNLTQASTQPAGS